MDVQALAGLLCNQIQGVFSGVSGLIPLSIAHCPLSIVSMIDFWSLVGSLAAGAAVSLVTSLVTALVVLGRHGEKLASLGEMLGKLETSLIQLSRDRMTCRDECLKNFVDRREHTQMVGTFTASEQDIAQAMREQREVFDTGIKGVHSRVNDILETVSEIKGRLIGQGQKP